MCFANIHMRETRKKMLVFYQALITLGRNRLQGFKLPTIVFVGHQSAGKTTLLEVLTGLPLGYSAQTTATRCPICWTITSGDDLVVKVNGAEVPPQNVASKTEDHMEFIRHNVQGEFTNKMLHIEVQKPFAESSPQGIFDLVIIDLPGLKSEGTAGASEVRHIASSIIRDPASFVVVVAKATPDDPETISDIDTINQLMTESNPQSHWPPRAGWKEKAIFVVNYLNVPAAQWQNFCFFYRPKETLGGGPPRPPQSGHLPDAKTKLESGICPVLLKSQSIFGHIWRGCPDPQFRSYLNVPAAQWQNFDNARCFFRSAENLALKDMFFVNLMPRSITEYNHKTADFDAKANYLANFIQYEADWFTKTMNNLPASGNPQATDAAWRSPEDNPYFGVKKTLQAIDDLWMRILAEYVPKIVAPLKAELKLATREYNRLEVLLKSTTAEGIRDEFRHFISDFLTQLQHLHLQRNVRKHLRTQEQHMYSAGTFGRTYAQDVELNPEGQTAWPFFLNIEQLLSKDHLGNAHQILGRDLTMDRIGVEAFRRVMHVFTYCVLVRPFDELDAATIEGFANSTGNSDGFAAFDVIVQMVLHEVNKALCGTEWLFGTIKALFGSYKKMVFDHLNSVDIYARVSNANSFIEEMTDAYDTELHNLLEDVKRFWNETLEVFSGFIDRGAPIKNLLGAMLNNVEDLLPTADYLVSPAIYAADAQQFDDEEDNPGGMLAPGLRAKRAAMAPNAKNLKKLDRVKEIRRYLTDQGKYFNVANIVGSELDLVRIRPQLRGIGIDHDYLRGVAREYYFVHMNRLLDILSASLNTKLIQRLTQDPGKGMEIKMLSLLEKYSDEQLLTLTVPDRERIESEFTAAESNVHDLKHVVKLSPPF
eukprot:GEMP01011188.1.p1 GENE.GEMP01011188.1~~GEMP01011188.1.p1  ORF type:complete len:877 (+),score=222.13 GEMP01011188.1:143-2773(+)